MTFVSYSMVDISIVNIKDRVWKAEGVAKLCYCSLSRDSYSARPVFTLRFLHDILMTKLRKM